MKIRAMTCFEHVQWSPSSSELRRFALTMLAGFAILALLAAAKRHGFGAASIVLLSIGAALCAGALVPGLGRWVYLGVNVPTGALGFVVSRVILTGLFFAVFLPLGLLLRALGRDLLRLRPPSGEGTWEEHPSRGRESYYRQY